MGLEEQYQGADLQALHRCRFLQMKLEQTDKRTCFLHLPAEKKVCSESQSSSQSSCITWLWEELRLGGNLLLRRHWKRSERKESSTAGSASIRSPSSMSRASGSILRESSREKGSISKPGT